MTASATPDSSYLLKLQLEIIEITSKTKQQLFVFPLTNDYSQLNGILLKRI